MTEEMKMWGNSLYVKKIEDLEKENELLRKELDVYRSQLNQTIQENIKLERNFSSAIKLHDNLLAKYEKVNAALDKACAKLSFSTCADISKEQWKEWCLKDD